MKLKYIASFKKQESYSPRELDVKKLKVQNRVLKSLHVQL